MSIAELQIQAPDPRLHLDALCDLFPKIFTGVRADYFLARDFCREVYLNDRFYDWQASRIGMIDGQLVTHYGVWGYQMRIGSARVRVGGIGAVSTHGDFRKRGLMDRTASAAVEGMRALGYDLSILFGIDNFYHRFGYTRAWAETDFYCSITDLPLEKPALKAHKFMPRHRSDLHDLYNQCHAFTTGTAVRPTYGKLCVFFNNTLEGVRWNDAQGALAGCVYFFQHGRQLECVEACGDAEQALRVLAMEGRKRNCDEVRFTTIPYMSDLGKRLRRGICRTQTYYRRCGAAMVCTINLTSTMEKMVGELSSRVQNSEFDGWKGDLRITNGKEEVTLAIDKGLVRLASDVETPHTISGGDEIGQLLMGTDTPGEIIDAYGIRLTGDARRLVNVLFPAQYPQLSLLDRY